MTRFIISLYHPNTLDTIRRTEYETVNPSLDEAIKIRVKEMRKALAESVDQDFADASPHRVFVEWTGEER